MMVTGQGRVSSDSSLCPFCLIFFECRKVAHESRLVYGFSEEEEEEKEEKCVGFVEQRGSSQRERNRTKKAGALKPDLPQACSLLIVEFDEGHVSLRPLLLGELQHLSSKQGLMQFDSFDSCSQAYLPPTL